jgi:hypothetical protein
MKGHAMKTEEIEGGLREVLARRAAEVPGQAGDRLRKLNYRPRGSVRPMAAGAGLAVAALAAGGGAYLAEGTAGVSTPDRSSATAAQAAGASIQLDGYTFKLPVGFKATGQHCTAPGHGGTPVAGSARFAAGAAAHGGCVEVLLLTRPLPVPGDATPVKVGPYQGYLQASPSALRHPILRLAIYGKFPGTNSTSELIVSAKNLSESQVINIAARALSTTDGPPKP